MSSKRSWIIYLLAAVSIAAVYLWTSSRDKFGEAEQLFARQDFVTAYLMYLELAQDGDARAQYTVSRILDEGLGPNIYDPDQALGWLGRSAQGGYGYAQLELGDLLFGGERLERDLVGAEEWWGRAADSNIHEALDKLFGLYPWDGDFSSARGGLWIQSENVARLTDLAEEGRPYAVVLMARFFATGLGVEQDLTHARELLEIAAANGNAAGHYYLGTLLWNNQAGEADLAAARTHFEAAANTGLGFAAISLAEMLSKGAGGPRDIETACFWRLIALKDDGVVERLPEPDAEACVATYDEKTADALRARTDAWSAVGPPKRIRAAQGMFH